MLSGVTLTTARVDARVQLDSGAVLRMLPAPTPRWPDLLTVHSDVDRMLFSGKVYTSAFGVCVRCWLLKINRGAVWRALLDARFVCCHSAGADENPDC